MEYKIAPLSEYAVVIEVAAEISQSSHVKVQVITAFLDEFPPSWMIEYIPAFTTVTIVYSIEYFHNEKVSPFEAVCRRIDEILLQVQVSSTVHENRVKIPVLYGNEFGPDLQFVADHNQLTMDEVIEIHIAGDYTVHMIGFAPGFPFIGGMSEKISAPRKNTPRLTIPARSVGIAGEQTGVYPIETPGGWQLIGRTPLELFLPEADNPSLLKAGDKIEFYKITEEEYRELRGGKR